MSKKKRRKSRHRAPSFTPKPEPIPQDYWDEVEASMARLEKRYAAAEKRREDAERKRDRLAGELARQTENRRRREALDEAERELEAREAELLEIAMLMQPSRHASARHRGTKSFNPGPDFAGKK